MKYLCLIIICAISCSSLAAKVEKDREAVAEEIDLSEPPFWMFTYDEFSDLQKSQKKFYIKNLGPALHKIDGLETLSQAKIDEAEEWYKTWNSIARQVFVACKDPKKEKPCKDLAALRKQALRYEE